MVTRAVRRLLAAGVLLLSAPLPVTGQPGSDPYWEFLNARRLESQGDVKGALAALERAAAADPASAEIRAEIASLHMRQNQFEAAEKAAREALSRSETSIEAHRVLGLIYSAYAEGAGESGQADKAPQYVKDAIAHLEKVVPAPGGATDVTAQYNLGRLYLRSGEVTKAVEALTRVVEQNPYSVQARLALAQALGEADRGAEAIDVLQSAAEDEPRLYATLAQYYERAGRRDEAADAYAKAIAVAPTNRELKVRMAALLLSSGTPADSRRVVEVLTPVIEQNPKDTRALYLRSQALRALGDRTAAEREARALVDLDPANVSGLFALIQSHFDAKRYSEAAVLAADAQKKHPSEAGFTRLHARALFRSGAASRAIAIMEASLKARPDESASYLGMADLYSDAGRYEAALKTLENAIGRFPKDADVLNYLGYLLADRGQRLDEAERLIRRALEIDADNPSYLDSLGWALFKRGAMEEAEEHLARAAAALPLNSVVQDHFGDLLARRGRHREAIDAWTRALKGDGEDIEREVIEKKIQNSKFKIQK
jgi:tetratricopeptide (TPR) repeat protein